MMQPAKPLLLGLPILVLLGCGGDSHFSIELTEEDGSHRIAGTVTMPDDTPSGRLIQFVIQRLDSPAYLLIEVVGSTDDSSAFDYEAVNASTGEYKVRTRVDVNDSGMFDSGDLDGFYGGTPENPVQDSDLATIITVSGASVDGLDFGIGPSS